MKTLDNLTKNQYFVLAVTAVIIFFILKGQFKEIARSIGLVGSKEEDKLNTETEKRRLSALQAFRTSPGWDTRFYASPNRPPNTKLITVADAERRAKLLWDSKGLFNDNEAQLYAAFNGLPSLAAMSFLSYRFQLKYNRDMKKYITDFTNETEKAELGTRIIKLPTWK